MQGKIERSAIVRKFYNKILLVIEKDFYLNALRFMLCAYSVNPGTCSFNCVNFFFP